MRGLVRCCAAIGVFACAAVAYAQPNGVFPVSKVQRGQTGYGLTTFAGTKPERFTFEVVSVGWAWATAAQATTPTAAHRRTSPRMCTKDTGPPAVPPPFLGVPVPAEACRRCHQEFAGRRGPVRDASHPEWFGFAGRILVVPALAFTRGAVRQLRDNCVRFCVGGWWDSVNRKTVLRSPRTSVFNNLNERSDLGTASAQETWTRR